MLNITEPLSNLSGWNSNTTLHDGAYASRNRIDTEDWENRTNADDWMNSTSFENWGNRTNRWDWGNGTNLDDWGNGTNLDDWGNGTNLDDWDNRTNLDEWDNHTDIYDTDNTTRYEFFILSMLSYAIMAIGIPGNALVIVSILSTKFLRTAPNILVLSLSVCDFLFLSIVVPVHAHTLRTRQWDTFSELCWFVGFLSNWLIGSSLLNIGNIALNRYVAVVLSQKYRHLSRNRTLAITLVFVYLVPFILLVPTFSGQFRYGTFGFDSREMMCGKVGGLILTMIYIYALVVIPLILMTLCYLHILAHILVTRRRVKELGNGTVSGQNRTTMMLAAVYVVYLVTTLPSLLINFLAGGGVVIPPYLDAIDFVAIWVSPALNPLVYGMVNTKYRKAYIKVMKKLYICSRQTK